MTRTLTACLIGLMACATPALADFKRITKENDFRAQVVGKVYTNNNGDWFRWNADGSISGALKNKQSFTGAWNWQRKFLCRNIRVGSKELGTDCQVIRVDGTTVQLIRKKGKGKTVLLRNK